MSATSQVQMISIAASPVRARRPKSAPISDSVVLHVLDHSWPVLSGYSVRSRNLLAAQQRLGYSVAALTGPLHQLDDPQATDATLDEVSYRRTPLNSRFARRVITNRWPVAREWAVVRSLQKQILEIIEREQVRVVYAHSPALCGLAALQAARRAGIPCVYEIRAFWEDAAADRAQAPKWRSQLTRGLETHVARQADAVAAISKPLLQDLESRGINPGKLFHVPNGVDTDRLVPMPKDEALARELRLGDGLVFGFFGSLYRYEGVSWMLEVMAQLHTTGQRFQVLIIGRGEDETSIRNLIRERRAENWVHIIDHVSHEQIGRYYSVIDIAVYPRRSIRLTELVTPLKPLEAMAFGKPVLASNVGGIRELVEHGQTGLLFEADVAKEFCHQALRLLASLSLRRSLAERGRDFVVRERDWTVLARRYAEIYRAVLSSSP